MPTPILYTTITSHGFGHATRTASILADVKRLCPDVVLIVVTTAPRWLLESYLGDDFILRSLHFDVGVIQKDSLTMDKAATLEKWAELRKNFSRIVRNEVNYIQQNRVGLVLADIPPLATAIAHAANVPCWMVSNFGWDFIYRPWGGEFLELADWIGDQFSKCDRLFRLPFHEEMSAFPNITDVGLTGSSPQFAVEEMRDCFQITAPAEQTILLTFGGMGLDQLPYSELDRFSGWQFITFDRNAPDLPNLLKVGDRALRPVDFMPLCGRIVSKPGYGTFSEACLLDVPIVSVTREDFAEGPILIDGIRQLAHHQILTPEELFHGHWNFLNDAPTPPQQPTPFDKTGNEAIARAILEYLL